MSTALMVAAGLAALIVGAEVLVRAGTGLAAWLGIRPMSDAIIGPTIVAVGYIGYLAWLLLTRT